jgi:hypothetical protein
MRIINSILAIAFSISLSSQGVYNLTYLDIPTQEISTFINLHDKITDMSFENREGVMNEFVFTHFQGAGKGVVIWSNYASVEDVYKDVRLQSVRKTWESLEGEEKEDFEKMVAEYLPYWNGHTDEIRNVDYQNNVLFSDDWDWDTRFLILMGDYPTTGDTNEAGAAFNTWVTKPQMDAGFLGSGGFSTHLSGSGSDLQVWSLYPDMMSYAKSFSVTGDTEARRTFWTNVGGTHIDNMYRHVGNVNRQTGKFNLAGPNRE